MLDKDAKFACKQQHREALVADELLVISIGMFGNQHTVLIVPVIIAVNRLARPRFLNHDS